MSPRRGSERLVDAVGFNGGTRTCRAALRRSRTPGDHAVARGGHDRIRADPLNDTGQTVQTGNERAFTAAGICNRETKRAFSWLKCFILYDFNEK